MADSYEVAAAFRAELRRFLRRSEDTSRANGITPRQHLLLLQIAGASDGVTTVSDLVNTLSLTQSAVTELVQRAEAAVLVERAPCRAHCARPGARAAPPRDGQLEGLELARVELLFAVCADVVRGGSRAARHDLVQPVRNELLIARPPALLTVVVRAGASGQ